MRFFNMVLSIVVGAILLPFLGNAQPTITSFAPSNGAIGTLVTITGTNLANPTALSIGGVSAIMVSNSGTQLVAMVMPGAITGTVNIATAGGVASGSSNFMITAGMKPNAQQGTKLTGNDAVGKAYQGISVSISADGKTAIVGGYFGAGAAWIYTLNNGVWIQQGNKLLGTGATGNANQGYSVAINADGNTAIIGGFADNGYMGAAWVFTRNGTVWTQQENKLVGSGANGNAYQGSSIAISADGNTAIVGGKADNAFVGAAWVFTRNSGIWTQQGNKLVGIGAIGQSFQGFSTAISGDGNTVMLGGYGDNAGAGAAWVFTRSNGVWTQQGNKLTGTGAIGNAYRGSSVAINADGNTAMVGGFRDNTIRGAVWVYTRNGTTCTQQGNKLIADTYLLGMSAAISADGNTAIVGATGDNQSKGAALVFTRMGGVWTQQGNKLVGTNIIGPAQKGISVALTATGSTAIAGGYQDNAGHGASWIFTYAGPVYTFTGSGNWNEASNWLGNEVPPTNLPAEAQIIINPPASEECILNVPVTVPLRSTITVSPGKKFRILGNLSISQ